jgi:hypothetical protein
MEVESNYDQDKIWLLPDFPDKSNLNEEIKIFLRQDINLILDKVKKYFTIIVVLALFRFLLVNLTSEPAWFYFLDVSIFGFSSILLVVLAYFFHNYYLTLIVFTNQRIIFYKQETLVSAKIEIIMNRDLVDIVFEREKARDVIIGRGSLIMQKADETSIKLEHLYNPEDLRLELLKFINLPPKPKKTNKEKTNRSEG